MHLNKLVKSTTGKYIMSILLGIGLASLFKSVCKGKNCVIYHAPPLDEIEDKIYKFDGKCYKFERVSRKCDSKKQILTFA
jgi:hypothetical protein